MNDDFAFLIFTYHNVFHSLLALASRFFQAEKMAASRTGVVRCWRDVRALLQVRVPNPAPLGYDKD